MIFAKYNINILSHLTYLRSSLYLLMLEMKYLEGNRSLEDFLEIFFKTYTRFDKKTIQVGN